jgi:hypothetical protein
MLYDVAIYDLKIGTVQDYMKEVRELGLPIRTAQGAKLAGWYYVDVGPVAQIIHIWGYEDYAHLGKAKAGYDADPRWSKEFLPKVRPYTLGGRHQIMKGADFFPGPR